MDTETLKRQNRIVLIILAILAVIVIGLRQYFNYSLTPVDSANHTTVTVTIKSGSTDRQVAQVLEKKGLVKSGYVFRYYLQTHKTSGVKAGTFSLSRSMTVPEITQELQTSHAARS
ncbi:MAG: endolytic transglycosylase MltG [Limosilactobacillus sp.]|uniref:endolytic transglycosylase MltG n=1 Tax=Limosilactobacillus sp. TaxID=2773925 RepID=UPI002710BAAD|nr:endolytic transglycosylase MltG [Limosilactobacillus sp.]